MDTAHKSPIDSDVQSVWPSGSISYQASGML